MARDREPALRMRLVPDVDAVVSRTGVYFLRGRESFFLDAKGAKKLADFYSEVADVGFDEALRAVLAGESPDPTRA